MYVDGTMENASLKLIKRLRENYSIMEQAVEGENSCVDVYLCEDCKDRIGILESVKDGAPPLKKLRSETTKCCQACFGLSDRLQELTGQVEAAYNSSGFQAVSTFLLCISVRSSALLVYQQAVWYHYDKEDGYQLLNSSPPSIVSLKNFIKLHLSRQLEEKLPLKHSADSPFEITVAIGTDTPNEVNALLQCLQNKQQTIMKRKKSSEQFSLQHITNLLSTATAADFQQNGLYPLPAFATSCNITVTFYHQPLFIGGRYNKYSRELSQSPWIIDGVKKTKYSVQELIVPIVQQKFSCKEIKFSSSGREDSDVRMLGNGRPFLLEMIEPMIGSAGVTTLAEVEKIINENSHDLIKVRSLQLIDKEKTMAIKHGEESKRKLYSALIATKNPITTDQLHSLDDTKELVILQKTPIRVLHRRPLLIRQKIIHSMNTQYINEQHFLLHLCTSAGTYVKEFVHGDLGRTVPNLCSILRQQVDIINLDVEEVEMEWP